MAPSKGPRFMSVPPSQPPSAGPGGVDIVYIPTHCKHVAHKTVPQSLPEDELADRLSADLAFFRTDFVVVTTEGRERACVFQLVREAGADGTLQPVERVTCLAGWDDTAVVTADVEVHDAFHVLAAVDGSGAPVTVLFGRTDHVMFVDLRTSLSVIHVYDIIPPEPTRLIRFIKETEHMLPVQFELHLCDLADEALKASEGTVVLPCSVAADQLELHGRSVLFFDQCDRETVASLPPRDTVAFGCVLGRDILETFGAKDVRTVTICPHERLSDPDGPFITRCCRTSRTGPVVIDDVQGNVLHWGASREEFLRAVLSFETPS